LVVSVPGVAGEQFAATSRLRELASQVVVLPDARPHMWNSFQVQCGWTLVLPASWSPPEQRGMVKLREVPPGT
jgi:hypothetical protein